MSLTHNVLRSFYFHTDIPIMGQVSYVDDSDGRCIIEVTEKESGAEHFRCVMPQGWKPTPFAAARVCDFAIGLVCGQDADVVPVGQVMHLVTHIASENIKQIAMQRADLTLQRAETARCTKEAQEQKELAANYAARLDVWIPLLIRTAISMLGEVLPNPKSELATQMMARLYMVAEGMTTRPEGISKVADLINDIGAKWK